jgi:hypothetical protein
VKNPLAIGLLVTAMVAVQASGQTALNPTVKVLPRPQSPVPAECADGVTSTQPPVANELPEPELQPQALPVPSSVPPSNELRTLLRRAQVAAAGEDYAAFKAAIADVRRAVASYPPGGERNAANEALRVYADIARVWDYAMASPTGSFFDNTAQGGSLFNALKRYPDFGRALAEETVTSGGRTLYPTRETRRFLVLESARRVATLGVSVPPTESAMTQIERPRRAAVPPVTHAEAIPPKKQTKPKSRPKIAEAEAAPKPHTTKHTPARTANGSSPKAAAPRIESTPIPKPKPEERAPAKIAATSSAPAKPPAAPTNTAGTSLPVPATPIVAAPIVVTPIVATPLPPATTSVATSTTTATTTSSTTAPAIDTTATGTTTTSVSTASTDTTDTAAADTATTGTAAPAEKQNGNMNLILAIVLILVGIGVLVVLFRASD